MIQAGLGIIKDYAVDGVRLEFFKFQAGEEGIGQHAESADRMPPFASNYTFNIMEISHLSLHSHNMAKRP
jgi:hypothetical protein